MSRDTFVLLCLGAVVLHCMAYALAYLGDAITKEPPPLHKVFTIYREALGHLSRAVRKHPTFNWGRNPFSEVMIRTMGDHMTFDLGRVPMVQEVGEGVYAEVRRRMLAQKLSYPPSQFRMVDALYRDWLNRLEMLQALHEAAQEAAKRRRFEQPATGWRAVLGLSAKESDPHVVRKAFRSLSSRAHPDKGGSNERQAELNRAWAQARDELGFV